MGLEEGMDKPGGFHGQIFHGQIFHGQRRAPTWGATPSRRWRSTPAAATETHRSKSQFLMNCGHFSPKVDNNHPQRDLAWVYKLAKPSASSCKRCFSFAFRVSSFGFEVWGLGFGVWGFGFRVQGSGFRVSGFVFRVSSFGFEVWSLGFGVWSFGFGVQGSGFGV